MSLYFIHTQNNHKFYHKSECLLHTCTCTSFMQIRCKSIRFLTCSPLLICRGEGDLRKHHHESHVHRILCH